VDFTFQRELPGKMLLEAGYIGRFARRLYMNGNMNSVPINFKDPKSGQTFAQAFDAVATVLRPPLQAGETLNDRINKVPLQAYFENLYGAALGANATRAIATARSANFINATISSLAQVYLDATVCGTSGKCQPLTNLQSQDLPSGPPAASRTITGSSSPPQAVLAGTGVRLQLHALEISTILGSSRRTTWPNIRTASSPTWTMAFHSSTFVIITANGFYERLSARQTLRP
jgi:hypothetical protein